MKRKHIVTLILTCLLFSACNNKYMLKNIEGKRIDEKSIQWVLGADSTLTIYGKGKMEDYTLDGDQSTAPWAKHLPYEIRKIVISDSITNIGDYAFYGCHALKEVRIPQSVTSIGYQSFYECHALLELTFPNSVTTIAESAFGGCNSLTVLNLPESVSNIGEGTFWDCQSLRKLTIPNSVVSIGEAAFMNCSSLKELALSTSIAFIGDEAFYGCGVSVLTIPYSIKEIGKSAFEACSDLVELTIPQSVTYIGGRAFSADSNTLKTIYSYCPMDAYSRDNFVFDEQNTTKISMYINPSDTTDYMTAQDNYWNNMNITLRDTPQP